VKQGFQRLAFIRKTKRLRLGNNLPLDPRLNAFGAVVGGCAALLLKFGWSGTASGHQLDNTQVEAETTKIGLVNGKPPGCN
jgi:hypothetical protein